MAELYDIPEVQNIHSFKLPVPKTSINFIFLERAESRKSIFRVKLLSCFLARATNLN